jgi:hypothetical protein
MVYYSKKEYKLLSYESSHRKNKMYNAVLQNKKTLKSVKVPFGDNKMENFRDATGLNLYPRLIHGDAKRRKNFRARHKGYLKDGYYSPSFFSYYILW